MRKSVVLALILAAASVRARADEPQPPARERQARAVRVWDPYLAQWRVEVPGRTWDPNLARYQTERRDQVWDPYLARYRQRDARRDPPAASAAFDRQPDGRHRHPGVQGWCFERH